MEIVIIWFLFGIVSAVVASNKGRSGCGWFALGVLLGPFGIILALVLSPNQEVVEESSLAQGRMKKCPFCAELIKIEAIKCRYCGEQLSATSSNTTIYGTSIWVCGRCQAVNMADAITCSDCGSPKG